MTESADVRVPLSTIVREWGRIGITGFAVGVLGGAGLHLTDLSDGGRRRAKWQPLRRELRSRGLADPRTIIKWQVHRRRN